MAYDWWTHGAGDSTYYAIPAARVRLDALHQAILQAHLGFVLLGIRPLHPYLKAASKAVSLLVTLLQAMYGR